MHCRSRARQLYTLLTDQGPQFHGYLKILNSVSADRSMGGITRSRTGGYFRRTASTGDDRLLCCCNAENGETAVGAEGNSDNLSNLLDRDGPIRPEIL